MTDPQGVAQQVIAQWSKENTSFTEMYGVQDGLKIMHRELSAEARTFLDELIQNSEGWTNEHGPDVRAQCLHEVEQLCNRLGLDLNEPEDWE